MGRLLATVLALLVVAVPAARADDGPAYSVSRGALDASLACTGDLAAGPAPVLLVPGTGEDPDFFAKNYVPALEKLGRSFCTVTLPEHGNGDIQIAAEYVVNAIRTEHARAGRRIAIIGHSQGGMVPRWALKFFPDTRGMVDDLVGLAASNHGTTGARAICQSSCSAANWQQRDDAKFIAALNAGGETFAGISYTSIYTHNDEIVTPNADADTGSTSLRTGDGARANVGTQDICPANTSEHLQLGSTDPVGYALAIDALTHAGPADPARIDRAVCAQIAQPGVDPVTGAGDAAAANAKVAAQFSSAAQIPAEPALKCYAGGPCPATATPAAPAPATPAARATRRRHHLLVTATSRHIRRGRHAIRVYVRYTHGKTAVPVAGVLVRLAGARGRTNARGVVILRKRFTTTGPRAVRATLSGFYAGRGKPVVVRR